MSTVHRVIQGQLGKTVCLGILESRASQAVAIVRAPQGRVEGREVEGGRANADPRVHQVSRVN